jgi:peroxiredoxin
MNVTPAANLQSEIDAVMVPMIPADVRRTIDAMIAELRTTNQVPGIQIGEPAPQFVLPDATGRPVALSDQLERGPVVLKFYRGGWCPVCNIELRSLQASLPEFESLGATLLAVNPQTPDESMDFAERLELRFDVLSDVDQSVADRYRIRFELPTEVQELYTMFGMALPTLNADRSWSLPVPATFVIERHGIVRARHVDADYQQRMEPASILAALRAI